MTFGDFLIYNLRTSFNFKCTDCLYLTCFNLSQQQRVSFKMSQERYSVLFSLYSSFPQVLFCFGFLPFYEKESHFIATEERQDVREGAEQEGDLLKSGHSSKCSLRAESQMGRAYQVSNINVASDRQGIGLRYKTN